MKIRAIYDLIDGFAPFSESMSFDNTGILVGDPNADVKTALICLDVTDDVINEAVSVGAELIISHHPIIFHPLKSVLTNDRVYRLIKNGLSVISAHTNLDKAYPGGVNDALTRALGLRNVEGVIPDGNGYIGYMGELIEEMTAEEFGLHVKAALGLSVLKYTPSDRKIKRVCVVGGSGGEYAYEAAKCGADAFVTGEVAHHEAIDAALYGYVIYEAGHYHTEIVYREQLKEMLDARCPGVKFLVSKQERPPMNVI